MFSLHIGGGGGHFIMTSMFNNNKQRSSTFDFSHRKILVIKQQLPFILANHHHTHTADI